MNKIKLKGFLMYNLGGGYAWIRIVGQMKEGSDKPRHKVEFQVGEYVRVKEGPFTDFNGSVEDVNYEKNKVRVSVTIFGRSTPVELDFNQIEKT